MSALNEQRPKVWVAFFGDVQLRLTASRVMACRLQPDVAAGIAALGKTVRIFESQDVGQHNRTSHWSAHVLHLFDQGPLSSTRLVDS